VRGKSQNTVFLQEKYSGGPIPSGTPWVLMYLLCVGIFIGSKGRPVGSWEEDECEAPRPQAGLPGEEVSFILCPLTRPIALWRDGARSGQILKNSIKRR